MKQYYYAIGSEQKGPFTLEELAKEKITKSTQIWFDGLDGWKAAGEVEELKDILKSVPPPLHPVNLVKDEKATDAKKNKKKYIKITLISAIVVVLITVVSLIVVSNYKQAVREGVSDKMREYETELPSPPIEEQEPKPLMKVQLLDKECQQPKDYLSGKMGYKPVYKNLLSMKVIGLKLNGSLTNKASLATFKDVEIKVRLLSATGASLYEKYFIVYDFLPAKSNIQFSEEIEISNQVYSDLEEFEWSIVGASCER